MTINAESLRLEQELYTTLLGISDQQTRSITEVWVKMWAEVKNELEIAMSELASATTTDRVTRTQVLRSRRAQAAMEALRESLVTAAQETASAASKDILSALVASTNTEVAIISSQLTNVAELQAQLIRADPYQLQAMATRATTQITSLSLPLAPRTYDIVRTELLRGVAVGSNPVEAARRMVRRAEDRVNFGLSRALTIARTEMLDATREAARVVDQANAAVLEGWVWIAHLDGRTCRSCIAQHGSIHSLEEFGPNDHQNGRCARVPQTKSWADLGFPDIPEPPNLIPDAEAWFTGLPEASQQQILGPAGFTAWKDGSYPLSDWSSRRSTDGWRDSFVPSKPPR